MSTTRIAITRTAILRETHRPNLWRPLLRALARAFDRLAPPRPGGRYAELPAAWFRHPPF